MIPLKPSDFDDHPQWTVEDARLHLANCIRRHLGAERDRLKALELALFIPSSVLEAEMLREQMGGYTGPIVQCMAFLAYAGDESRFKVVRFHVSHRLKWASFDRWVEDWLAPALRNGIAVMRRDERQQHAAAAGDEPAVAIEPDRSASPLLLPPSVRVN